MRYLFVAVIATVLLSACQQAPEEKDDILVVRCGAVIDGLADEVLGPTTVLIRNERIEREKVLIRVALKEISEEKPYMSFQGSRERTHPR